MSYSITNNVRSLFSRKPPAKAANTPPPLSSYERGVQAHRQMTDDGLGAIRHHPDIERLIDILSLNRNADAPGLQHLLDRHLTEGFITDPYGNRFKVIPQKDGSEPSIAYTAHCDTVSNDTKALRHPLCYNREKDVLFRNDGNVLGADDGTGIWLLLGMIDANVPGLYCFYLDEETGREGSEWSWAMEPGRYDNIDIMISFDRKGTEDIIATQRGSKCCSPEFQQALANTLSSQALGLTYKPGAHGSFTDSATFMDTFPECTNVAVGYDRQHTPQETQLVEHVSRLRTTLRLVGHLMHDNLPVRRDPDEKLTPAPITPSYYDYDFDLDMLEEDDDLAMLTTSMEYDVLKHGNLEELIEYFPEAIAAALEELGWDDSAMANYIAQTFYGLGDIRSADTNQKD